MGGSSFTSFRIIYPYRSPPPPLCLDLNNTHPPARFLKINGYQIPKSDVVALIKLYYSLITQDDYNLSVIKYAANAFNNLLGKKAQKKLTRDDLILEWEPLYKLSVEVFYGRGRNTNLKVGFVIKKGKVVVVKKKRKGARGRRKRTHTPVIFSQLEGVVKRVVSNAQE
eukprot:sb/3472351/